MARLGVIVPSANTVIEPTMLRYAPPGVSFAFSRVLNSEDTEEQLRKMGDAAIEAAELISHAQVKAIALGCTGGSFFQGPGYDQDIIRRMEARTGVKCTTASTAVIEALSWLGARKIMVLTPYEDWLTERGCTFLKGNGFEVVGSRYLSIADVNAMTAVSPEQIHAWAKEDIPAGTEALFFSCTNFRAADAAEALERDLGLPVVTSNQATLRALLRLAGIDAPVEGCGKVLRGKR